MQTVLHVIDKLSMEGRHPSSCTMMIARWARGLRQRGFALDLAVLRPRDTVAEVVAREGLNVLPIGFGSHSPRNIPALSRLIRQRGYRLLHLHGYGAADYGRLAARHAGARTVLHEHAVLPVRPHQWLADRMLRRLTDAAVAVSGEVRDFMIRGRSVPAELVQVIPNGIDLERFESLTPEEGRPLRRRLGLLESTPLIGTVTRLHPLKGNRFLVDAAPAILAAHPTARILIAGDGPERAALEARARRLGLEGIVCFDGYATDPAAVYAALDVFALPSLQEGFGLAALEAMASAKPVVVSDTGGLPRLVSNRINGLLAPPGNAAALAAQVVDLLNHPDEARRLGERARLDSRDYDIDRTLNALAALYTELT